MSSPTITWVYNYICERYQAVINTDSTITSWAKSSYEVSQGSILDMLLFALYITDLPNNLRGVLYMSHRFVVILNLLKSSRA